jgi:hypothetical protein
MDSDGNAGITVEQLRAQAPRSFDKILIDLLVAIQHGHAPIVAETPIPDAPRDVSPALLHMASELDTARERIRRLEAIIARLAMEAARDAA